MKKLIIAAVVIFALLAGVRLIHPNSAEGPTIQERQGRAADAVKRIEADVAWPATPEALIKEFWKAASEKDYERLTVLCPGSAASDFKAHYDQFTPGNATAVGPAQPHPKDKSVMLYPTTVPFPHFPNKTVKMAVSKTAGGKLTIDGEKTIWW